MFLQRMTTRLGRGIVAGLLLISVFGVFGNAALADNGDYKCRSVSGQFTLLIDGNEFEMRDDGRILRYGDLIRHRCLERYPETCEYSSERGTVAVLDIGRRITGRIYFEKHRRSYFVDVTCRRL